MYTNKFEFTIVTSSERIDDITSNNMEKVANSVHAAESKAKDEFHVPIQFDICNTIAYDKNELGEDIRKNTYTLTTYWDPLVMRGYNKWEEICTRITELIEEDLKQSMTIIQSYTDIEWRA
jgi:hypothetical protein